MRALQYGMQMFGGIGHNQRDADAERFGDIGLVLGPLIELGKCAQIDRPTLRLGE